ncbi:MAG: hypothetical protein HY923_08955 [Elusimicrobia bacterium]|nr:hypothetical protein [Elusimicrobiota bacterium]
MKTLLVTFLIVAPISGWCADAKELVKPLSEQNPEVRQSLQDERAKTSALRTEENIRIAELKKSNGLTEADRASAINKIQREFLNKRNAERLKIRIKLRDKLLKMDGAPKLLRKDKANDR